MEYRRRAIVAMAVLAGAVLGVFVNEHAHSELNSALVSGTRVIPCDLNQLDERLLAERDLEKMILVIDGVGRARVSLTPANEADGRFYGEEPAASVMIDLKPGGALPHDRLKAIARLVANGRKGLSPHRVLIMDFAGRPYGERRGG